MSDEVWRLHEQWHPDGSYHDEGICCRQCSDEADGYVRWPCVAGRLSAALAVLERAQEEAERELAAAESEITSLLSRNAHAVALIEQITGHDYTPEDQP